jgi:hypothetical protein
MKKYMLVAVALVGISATANAQVQAYLRNQWLNERGQRMCQYSNGTVLNIGVGVCPVSIPG